MLVTTTERLEDKNVNSESSEGDPLQRELEPLVEVRAI